MSDGYKNQYCNAHVKAVFWMQYLKVSPARACALFTPPGLYLPALERSSFTCKRAYIRAVTYSTKVHFFITVEEDIPLRILFGTLHASIFPETEL